MNQMIKHSEKPVFLEHLESRREECHATHRVQTPMNDMLSHLIIRHDSALQNQRDFQSEKLYISRGAALRIM